MNISIMVITFPISSRVTLGFEIITAINPMHLEISCRDSYRLTCVSEFGNTINFGFMAILISPKTFRRTDVGLVPIYFQAVG